MTRPLYEETPDLWDVDGSLRDIYILDTDLSDWEKFLRFVLGYSCIYTFNGESGNMPDLEKLFDNRDGSHLLSIKLSTITANCHFFIPSEIELDLDPKEILDASAHEEALSFVEGLARAVGKNILLTPENRIEFRYLSFDPMGNTWRVYR